MKDCKHAFDCAPGRTLGRYLVIASLGRRQGRRHFEVHRTGAKAIPDEPPL
jgi:hypothetical protein